MNIENICRNSVIFVRYNLKSKYYGKYWIWKF
nr:MAG TPA: hypothetical protein [Caudoviricetes sp.]